MYGPQAWLTLAEHSRDDNGPRPRQRSSRRRALVAPARRPDCVGGRSSSFARYSAAGNQETMRPISSRPTAGQTHENTGSDCEEPEVPRGTRDPNRSASITKRDAEKAPQGIAT